MSLVSGVRLAAPDELEFAIGDVGDFVDLVEEVGVAARQVFDPTLQGVSRSPLRIRELVLVYGGEVGLVDDLLDEALLHGQHKALLVVQASDHVLVQRDLVLEQVERALESVALAQKLLLVSEQLLVASVELLKLSILLSSLSPKLLYDLVSHCDLLLQARHSVVLLRRCFNGPRDALAIHQN